MRIKARVRLLAFPLVSFLIFPHLFHDDAVHPGYIGAPWIVRAGPLARP